MKEYDLRKRLFCAFFLVIFIPLPILFFIGIKGIIPYMERAEMSRIMKETTLAVGDVQGMLKGFKSDVLMLSESNEISDLISGLISGERDLQKRKRLTNLFVSFAKHRGIYYQVRYIDENGMEIVRVDDGLPVPEKRLQDKSDRYFFREAVKLKENTVYVSPLDLNQEWGKIEVPFRPVIRYAVPVFDKKGANKGIVITNVDARQILQRLQSSTAAGPVKTMLIDSSGYYLLHPDRKKEWGGPADLNTGENIKKDYPEGAVKKFFSRNADIMIKKATVCSYAPVFSSNNEEGAWIFIHETSLSGMIKIIHYLRSMIIIITIASAIAGTYLSYVLAGWLSRIKCKQEK
jgi:methyl-accepting chemotaxis protein